MIKIRDRRVLRILDASANRAGEGLRTMEEWARMSLDDIGLSTQLKTIRHGLAAAIAGVDRAELLAARDTPGDVGTAITCADEQHRHSPADVVAAAVARVGQSLRVVEEYLKTVSPTLAHRVEQIRYQFYTVSAQLELRMSRSDRSEKLRHAVLYALIEAGDDTKPFEIRVRKLCHAGVDIIQLRDRTVSDRVLIQRGRLGTQIANASGVLFLMNDRADLAVAAGCDGVHVGQDELPAADARAIIGHRRLLGVSTHHLDQAHQAVADGADYLGCGPVFPSQTKSFDHHVGLAYVQQAAHQISIPWFAIGGIGPDNVGQVAKAGGRRVAVTAALKDLDAAEATAADIKRHLVKQEPKPTPDSDT